MHPNDIVAHAITLMHKEGLLARGWQFKINSNKTRLGVCKFRTANMTHDGRIEVSRFVTDEAVIKNTIAHEVAHAVVGTPYHDDVWRSKAMELGCDGKRCGVIVAPHLYETICPVHGVIGRRHRMPKGVKQGRVFSCNKCAPNRFDPRYLVSFVRV